MGSPEPLFMDPKGQDVVAKPAARYSSPVTKLFTPRELQVDVQLIPCICFAGLASGRIKQSVLQGELQSEGRKGL